MAFSELHLHLDGSLSLGDMRYLAPRAGVELPRSDDELHSLMVAPAGVGSLSEYLKRFELPLSVLTDGESVRYATASLVRRLSAIGVDYAEIRFAPALHTSRGASEYDIIEGAVCGFGEASRQYGVGGGIILCCMRGGVLNKRQNLLTSALAADFRGRGVVGLDLAGDEAKDSPSDYDYAFALAREANVNITIHAGEAGGPDKVRAALRMGAKRIGHGVRAAEDEELVGELAERGVTLELCYTSNLNTGAATPDNFPLRYFLSRGVRVTINSDNMTVSDTDISKEVARLELSPKEIALIERYGKEARFA